MNWLRLHNALDTGAIDEVHECALVLSLEEGLRERVNRERQLFGDDKLLQRQLDPHITLLYCGFQPPAQLKRLDELGAGFVAREIEFQVKDVSIFYNRAGLLTNVHYTVESAGLHALHRELLAAYRDAGFQMHTPYVGDHYTPHISIFDRLVMPKTVSTLFKPPNTDETHRAGGCHLVGEKQRR